MFNKERDNIVNPESTYIVKNSEAGRRKECCYYEPDVDGSEQLRYRYFERPNLKRWTQYDELGREMYSLDSNGVEIRWLYLQNGWKEKHSKDAQKSVEIHAYDGNDVCRDFMFQRFEPKKYFRRVSYDARGNRTYCLFPDGRVEKYEYCDDGRLKVKEILLPDGSIQKMFLDLKQKQLRECDLVENIDISPPKAFTDFVDTVKFPSQK